MSDTNFIPQQTVIRSTWLNDVDKLRYGNGDRTRGSDLLEYLSGETGAVPESAQDKFDQVVNLLDFGAAGQGGDDTAFFQAAIDTHKTVWVPKGNYSISTVNIGVYGCDIRLDKEAVVTVQDSGGGLQRNLPQTPRATFIAGHSLLDATNYYYTFHVEGGSFICGVGSTAISDRVPFLVYTGVPPAPADPGILLQKAMIVERTNITLTDAGSIGIGIYGGWGTSILDCTIEGYNAGTGILLGGSSADGDTHCQPQLILVDGCVINSCNPFNSATNGCTNSAEALAIVNTTMSFVQYAYLNNVNSLRWVNNLFVSDNGSLDFVDSGDVTVSLSYFESDHDPTNTAKPGIVNAQNCSNFKFVDSSVFVLATPVATARDGLLIAANAVNETTGVVVVNNRFQHAPIDPALETNAVRFVAAAGVGQILNIVCKDNVGDEWHNLINFTDHVASLATRVDIAGSTNNNGNNYIKGVDRIAVSGRNIPEYYVSTTITMMGVSDGSGSADPAATFGVVNFMHNPSPSISYTGFTNVSNCQSITAVFSNYTIQFSAQQTAASSAGDRVKGTSTVIVDGTAV